jgi:exosome complex protein LRP1
MEVTELLSLLEDLEDNIDDLEESLEPLLAAALSATTKKLPLLDRAKLYTLLVYSIESLLFCTISLTSIQYHARLTSPAYLRLNGVQAKEHAVFQELTRVKQYFQKIKQAEDGQNPTRPAVSLNKQATGRFIKQALAGNDRYDTERAEREAREKLLATRKGLRNTRSAAPEPLSQPETSAPSPAEQQEDLEDGEVDDQEDSAMVDVPAEEPQSGNAFKQRRGRKKKVKMNQGKVNDDGIVKATKAKNHRNRVAVGFKGNLEQELVKPG